jgi:hypothetical protein
VRECWRTNRKGPLDHEALSDLSGFGTPLGHHLGRLERAGAAPGGTAVGGASGLRHLSRLVRRGPGLRAHPKHPDRAGWFRAGSIVATPSWAASGPTRSPTGSCTTPSPRCCPSAQPARKRPLNRTGGRSLPKLVPRSRQQRRPQGLDCPANSPLPQGSGAMCRSRRLSLHRKDGRVSAPLAVRPGVRHILTPAYRPGASAGGSCIHGAGGEGESGAAQVQGAAAVRPGP